MSSRISRALIGLSVVLCGVGWAKTGPKQGTFKGTVVDAAGRPVAGAEVTRYVLGVGARDVQVQIRGKHAVKTGVDGAFAFTAAPPDGTKPAAAHVVSMIVAEKAPLAISWTNWESHTTSKTETITLGEPETLAGTVTDEAGTPVAGADVQLSVAALPGPGSPRFLMGLHPLSLFRVATDAQGQFRFEALPKTATADLRVSKQGMATVNTFTLESGRMPELSFKPGQPGIELKLVPESRIRGVVRNDAGEPVPGVALAPYSGHPHPFTGLTPVTSAEDGSFEFDGLAAGAYSVTQIQPLTKPGEWTGAPVAVELKKGETLEGMTFKVGRGGLLQVVVQSDDGTPIEGAHVNVQSPPPAHRYHGGRTDREGKAEFRLAAGKYTIRNVYKHPVISMHEAIEIEIVDGQTTVKRIEGKGLPKITGTLRDRAGQPVEGAVAKVLPMGSGVESTSAADGTFSATWNPRSWGGNPPQIVLIARHVERNLAAAAAMNGETKTMDLVLDPALIIAGHVAATDGTPIEGVRASIMWRGDRWSSSLNPAGKHTDARGRYEIPAVPVGGRCSVYLQTEGYGTARTECDMDQVRDGRLEMPTMVLKLANLSITGVVVDADDNPVMGAYVNGYGDGQPHRHVRTDAEGRFTLGKICAGDIRLNAYKHGRPTRYGRAQTEGGAEDIKIVISERTSSRSYYSTPDIPYPKLGEDFDPDAALYWTDFQGEGVDLSGWSNPQVFRLPDSDKQILGAFSNEPVELALEGLPPHRYVRLYFEFHALCSWDGATSRYGPDLWTARVHNGPRLVHSSFCNIGGRQSYPMPFAFGHTGSGAAGKKLEHGIGFPDGRTWETHYVYPMCFTFPHEDEELVLYFAGVNLQQLNDECWGLDNVGIQFLDEHSYPELDPAQLDSAWTNLGSSDVAKAYAAMNALVKAGDQAVTFLTEKLEWGDDAELQEDILEIAEVLQYNDFNQWTEASEELREVSPRALPLIAWFLDSRRFSPDPPPWMDEIFSPTNVKEASGTTARRTGRASRVLELIWTDAAQRALLFK